MKSNLHQFTKRQCQINIVHPLDQFYPENGQPPSFDLRSNQSVELLSNKNRNLKKFTSASKNKFVPVVSDESFFSDAEASMSLRLKHSNDKLNLYINHLTNGS